MPEDIYLPVETYQKLLAALVRAATKLFDVPELIDVDELKLALGEAGDIWPDSIQEAA